MYSSGALSEADASTKSGLIRYVIVATIGYFNDWIVLRLSEAVSTGNWISYRFLELCSNSVGGAAEPLSPADGLRPKWPLLSARLTLFLTTLG